MDARKRAFAVAGCPSRGRAEEACSPSCLLPPLAATETPLTRGWDPENDRLCRGAPHDGGWPGPHQQGWQGGAPYDVIFLNGATEIAPQALTRQLKDGGRLVGVLGRAPTGQAMLYRSVGGDVSGWPIFDAAAPVLPGFAAPPEFVF